MSCREITEYQETPMTRILTAAAFALTALIGVASAQESSQVEEMALGDPDAPVTVVEYASFTCPHCANFHETNFARMRDEYIDTGKVRWVYREVYFDRFGLWAALVARCGGEDSYFGMVDLLYEKQGEWTQGEPGEIAENLRRLGRSAGLGEDELNACLEDGDKLQALVAEYQRNAEADDISSTPSFVIGGETYSNRPFEDLAALIDEQLGG
jgi:protein-disulfide isomerase